MTRRSNLPEPRNASLAHMLGYGLGECANSLVMNGLFGFAMLCYTDALKLPPSLAGLALAVSVFWEAITEPVMGHYSDHTRSRYGRRHPWMLLGGLTMAASFYFLWAVPEGVRSHPWPLFGYLVGVNLLLRTGLTMFFIPYLALGFEMCGDYEGRAKLQAVRQTLNMAANLAGPALAWSVFFHDRIGADGMTVAGTTVPENYVRMGAAFSLATAAFVLATLWLTRRWIEDTRATAPAGTAAPRESFRADMKQVLLDPHARWIFVYIVLACVGMVLVSSLQMYLYGHFMRFAPHEKTLAHGSTMVGMAAGAALSPWIARRLDKKGAVLAGGFLSIGANVLLAALFLTGLAPVGTPAALVLFVAFHAAYWFGNGVMLPVATSMMADVAELHRRRTGVNKDGAYSAVFSLAMRLAISFGLMASGWTLSGIGFVADGTAPQPAAVIWRLGAATFLAGPLVCAAALAAIARYPLSRAAVASLSLDVERARRASDA